MERMIVGKSPPSKLVLPGPPGKRVSPLNSSGWPSSRKHIEPGVWPGVWIVRRRSRPTSITSSSVDDLVVARQHVGVLGGDADGVAGVAQLGHGLDVVPVAVGLEHLAHAEGRAQLEQALVLVGGVEQDGVAGLGAAHHVDVVVHRAHDDLVDLDAGGLPGEGAHAREARSMCRRVVVVVVALVLAACGGGDDDDASPDEEPAAADVTTTTASTSPGVEVDLVATGEPTAFEPGDGRAIEIDVAGDGTCTSDQTTLDDSDSFFGLCQVFEGDGGTFALLTVSRDTDDHDTGVLCATDDGTFSLWAVALGTGTPVTTTLELPNAGEFALVAQHDGFVTDATTADGVIVAQPAGADCPELHGLGPVAPGAGNVQHLRRRRGGRGRRRRAAVRVVPERGVRGDGVPGRLVPLPRAGWLTVRRSLAPRRRPGGTGR